MGNSDDIALSGPTIKRGRSKQDYATPEDFRHAVEMRFGVPTFDLAASEHNYFVKPYYSQEQNSLVRPWSTIAGVLWLNPPFTHIEPWAAKCRYEAERGATILFLTPASVGSVWFANHVHRHACVLQLTPRLSFDGIAPYPKDCILSVYWAGLNGYDVWKWK